MFILKWELFIICYGMKEKAYFLGEDVYCIASTVSSKILHTICHKEGFNFVVRVCIFMNLYLTFATLWTAQTHERKIRNTYTVLQETLTGFKWMGNKACDLMQQGKTVIFAFEEAIGKCTKFPPANFYGCFTNFLPNLRLQ